MIYRQRLMLIILAERLQAQEQEELSIKEKAILFQQLLEKRRKHFAAKRAEDKRNKSPTKAQHRKIMCTYLKNMEGYKLNDLKLKDFDYIQEMFDRAFKRANTFEDFRTKFMKGKEKRLTEIIPDEEEVAIDAIPLAVKSPSIVDWKIYKEGRKSYYQIIRADGKSQMYMIFSHMLKSFNREDLETLYKLVKAKYESTRPVEDMNLVLWNDLKTMFEPHVEDAVWMNQQDYKVLSWKLYDSCGVHFLRMQHVQIYMLVEKKYPLTPSTLTMMLEKKLTIDYESEMAYQLLKFITQKPRKPKRKDTQIPQSSDPSDNVANEAVHKELGDSLVRAATTASSLEAEHDSGNITKTRSKATPNESSSLKTTSGSGPKCQEAMRDTIAQTRFENVAKHFNDSLLARGNTLRSDDDRLKLNELMALCTTLQNKTQANEIASLKRRAKKLEKKDRSRTHKLKRLYKVGLTARVESSDDEESLGEVASKQGRIDAIDADE
ncbi:hypothetical protein Tco_1152396 [Tanacetum coccineum]